jgi:hypothetical protein
MWETELRAMEDQEKGNWWQESCAGELQCLLGWQGNLPSGTQVEFLTLGLLFILLFLPPELYNSFSLFLSRECLWPLWLDEISVFYSESMFSKHECFSFRAL